MLKFLSRCCDVEPCTFPDVEPCTFPNGEPFATQRWHDAEPLPTPGWIEDTVYCLKAWRPVAVETGNTTLVEMTDQAVEAGNATLVEMNQAVEAGNATWIEMTEHACSVRKGSELEAVKRLYIDTFSLEARWPFLRPSGEVRKARSGAA